jgi:nicotinic acid mononucleotide adenylyltransferase
MRFECCPYTNTCFRRNGINFWSTIIGFKCASWRFQESHTFKRQRPSKSRLREWPRECKSTATSVPSDGAILPQSKTGTLYSSVSNAAASSRSEEQRQSLRVGTADLLDMLMENEPNVDFSFCLGADTFLDLTQWKWRRSRDVFRLTEGRLLVLFRRGVTTQTDDSLEELIARINQTESAQVELLDVPTLNEVSSSAVRSCNDEKRLGEMLSEDVLEYVKENRLYAFMDAPES